ncbi:MAG: tyrosine-protein phosphatase [Saccharofermentans sp.]|nr:tyrosine-protein phosphatase [Saccharofermentans sp.]
MSNYNPESQRIIFEDLLNCRELGGMPVAGNRLFPNGLFLRSGCPYFSSPSALSHLKSYGVKTVIDLRSEAEASREVNPFEADKDVSYYNIPLFVGDPSLDQDPTMEFLRTHHLGDFYVIMLNELGDRIVKIMNILRTHTDGICLFHCAHGKDRTGVIAALLYLLAGASREDIILNYKVSYDYAKDFLDPLIANKDDDLKHTLRSDAVNMEICLDYIESEFASDAGRYLLNNGMTLQELEELKSRFTV